MSADGANPPAQKTSGESIYKAHFLGKLPCLQSFASFQEESFPSFGNFLLLKRPLDWKKKHIIPSINASTFILNP